MAVGVASAGWVVGLGVGVATAARTAAGAAVASAKRQHGRDGAHSASKTIVEVRRAIIRALHEAPRHRRRRLHRLDRGPAAASTRGDDVTVLDSLERGHRAAVPPRARARRGRPAATPTAIARRARRRGFDGVLHFAALALVGESVEHPERYYRGNVVGTLNLLDAMRAAGVQRLVFSSTARDLRRAGERPDRRGRADRRRSTPTAPPSSPSTG